MDIRKPVGIEMDYTVLESGQVLAPNLHFFNEEGVCIFILHDLDPIWSKQPRPTGDYTSVVWIPGNYLSEGTLVVGAAITTYIPFQVHFFEQDAVAFQVIDSLEGNSARGDFAGVMPGVVRPLLNWNTHPRSG
jgi:lipopolysaccharide transport system ATP-binding protein